MFRDQSSHAVSMQNLKRCILCGPSPIATGPGPVIGSSENRSQLTGSAPLAKRQALFNILNFLPAMKSGTTCTDKESRKLAKQRHLPCSQNTPEETFSKPFKMLHTILERKSSPLHPGTYMFSQTQLHALPAPQARHRIQNTTQESGPGCFTDVEL